MNDNKTNTITLNDVEYIYEDMTEKQQVMVNHCADLDAKIRTAAFNIDQLTVAKDSFIYMLTEDLENT